MPKKNSSKSVDTKSVLKKAKNLKEGRYKLVVSTSKWQTEIPITVTKNGNIIVTPYAMKKLQSSLYHGTRLSRGKISTSVVKVNSRKKRGAKKSSRKKSKSSTTKRKKSTKKRTKTTKITLYRSNARKKKSKKRKK